MEVIDFHTHIYPPAIIDRVMERMKPLPGMQPKLDGTADGLIKGMDESGTTCSVVLPVATTPHQFESVNSYAYQVGKSYPRLITFGSMHPGVDDIKGSVHRLYDMGMKGFKVHPDYQETDFDDPRYIEMFKEAASLGMIVVTHSGLDPVSTGHVHCVPDMILKVRSEVPDLKLVCAHVGARSMLDEVEEKLAGQDLYFDISRLSEVNMPQVKRIIEKHGADKILYASDSPWEDMKINLALFLGLGFDIITNEKILSGNAIKLLGMSPKRTGSR